jgi:glycosyltransferase involved in cell wall biosynthesis
MSNFSVGCFGYGGNVALIELFREELELAGIQIKTCHEYPSATTPFTPDTIHSFIDSCDVILLPARVKLQPAKSVNRLALAWSRRKPCIVSPLPAYLDYVVDGVNALVADSKEQWLEAVFKLRDDPDLRVQIANAGMDTAQRRLNPRQHTDKLFNLLSQNGLLNPWPVDTFVQIIIPHYTPRCDYLLLAVKSALESIGPARDVLVVSSSSNDPRMALNDLSEQFKNLRVIYQTKRLSFAEANNLGIKNCDKRTTHFLLLNDDTILSQKCLAAMVSRVIKEGNNFLLNPYSNCDKKWLHDDTLKIADKELVPGMFIEQFTEDELERLKVDGFNFSGEWVSEKRETTFCAMYCTLIPKGIVDRVGFLNTLFKNGGEDLDYCERAKRMGFGSYWDMGAMCFHFGGKTRKVAESENFGEYHKEDLENNLLARKRWPKGKKRIGIWTGPAWEHWDLDNYRQNGAGIGGSEYVEGSMAEAAAAAGHHVTLYTSIGERKHQYGVDLVPWNEFIPEEEYFDLFIASRNLNCIDPRLRTRRKLLHIHDIWALSGQHISEYHLREDDKFICLSPWHKEFVKDYHKLADEKIDIIPNGINYDWFNGMNLEKKLEEVEWGRLHWSSSPDRGLDNVLYLMPWILEKCPDLKLHVYYGFHNWISAAKSRNNKMEMESIERLQKQIDEMKDHVVFHDRVNQVQLAKEWRKAWMWFYPSSFTETFCLTAKEAQLSFTPVVCSNVAALQTAVGEYGHRVMHHPYSREAREEFLVKVIELYQNRDRWVEASLLGNGAVSGGDYRWERIWKMWEKYLT